MDIPAQVYRPRKYTWLDLINDTQRKAFKVIDESVNAANDKPNYLKPIVYPRMSAPGWTFLKSLRSEVLSKLNIETHPSHSR